MRGGDKWLCGLLGFGNKLFANIRSVVLLSGVHRSQGSTVITWKGVKRAIGYKVISHGQTLNGALVRSRTNRYRFRIHRIIHRVHLEPMERIK